ncbi:hypothetical protein EPO44_09165 [bacterium]|nr:MAG: hypothetical protein EPO44_09165 [bacterium]
MDVTLSERIRSLQEAPARWWAGEAEVVRVYFSRKRTKEDDIRWLTLQAARELGTACRQLEDAPAMLASIEESVDRHEFEGAMRSIYEEARHYRLLADILESLTGQKVKPKALLPYSGTLKERKGHPELPAMTAEIQVTKRLYEQYGELAAAALSFFEGGGAAIFYSGSRILHYPYVSYSNGEIEKKIAAAMKVIFEDEMRHGPVHIPEAAKKLQTNEDFFLARSIIESKAKAHLRLRNETFSYPLTDKRMQEIDDGINIGPLPVNYLEVTPISPYSV